LIIFDCLFTNKKLEKSNLKYQNITLFYCTYKQFNNETMKQ